MSKSSSQSNSWFHRKAKLQTLLGNCGDDEEEGLALDRILHGQPAIAKTQKTSDIENLRFSDKDLTSFGPLADAQFGTVELVSCRLDGRVYVRKRVSKKFAQRNREQCSPQYERHILLHALKSQTRSFSSWTAHMLCAYQCPSFLNIVMEYAAGGSLWDVLESSADGRLAASDLEWWAPQCVSAIDWLHSRAGFVHRDIKPHNFVVRPGSSPQLLLIDFGSAAPLLKPGEDGVQLVARSHCLVPCGTCDYISPEILQAHEEALVALELSDDERDNETDEELPGARRGKSEKKILQGDVGYGRETDWWSLGVMLYELAFGVAPFFANDIRQTYARIMNHESNLVFDKKVYVPSALISLIKGLLTHYEERLGRRSTDELKNHAYFKDVDWSNLRSRSPPPNLLLPEFTYATPLVPPDPDDDKSESSTDTSKPFVFSALFQSSPLTTKADASSFHVNQHDAMSTPAVGRRSFSRAGMTTSAQRASASFIGFSWGPPKDAFDDATRIVPAGPASAEPGLCKPPLVDADVTTPQYPPITPKRPSQGTAPPSTVRVTSVRRSGAQSRPVSDREAMRVLVNCVGQSARKRVLESGKKPKVLLPQFGFGPLPPAISSAALRDSLNKGLGRPRASSLSRSHSSPKLSAASTATGGVRKELRFDDTAPQIMPNLSYSYTNTFTTTLSNSAAMTSGGGTGTIPYIPPPYSASDSGNTTSELGDGPPSPSPSPRPGSAMSMLSMSRRSATPTASSAFLTGVGVPSRPNSEPPELRPGRRARAGSLGSLNAVRDADTDTIDAKEMGVPRRARFVDSPDSSPERTQKRAPGTPHPKARLNQEKEGKAGRRAQFADISDESEDVARERGDAGRVPATSTPHPRAARKLTHDKEQKTRPAATAHFLDSPPGSSDEVIKMPIASTPHPKRKAQAQTRRDSRPPLETRPLRMTSTPARPGTRRSTAPVVDPSSSDDGDDVTIRPQDIHNHRQTGAETKPRLQGEGDAEGYGSDEDTETLPEYDSLHHPHLYPQSHPRCRNPSPPSSTVCNDDDDDDISNYLGHPRPRRNSGEFGMLDDMEVRYKRLLADIANVSLHIEEFASRVAKRQ